MKSSYRLRPTIDVEGTPASGTGYAALSKLMKGYCVLETYPGFPTSELIDGLRQAGYDGRIAIAEDYCPLTTASFRSRIMSELTEDRVFGKFTMRNYADFYDHDAIDAFVSQEEGRVLVVGVGASLFKRESARVFYADMPRWHLQQAFRSGKSVFFKGGHEEDALRNFKRGYFVEWRMADRIKKGLWAEVAYFITTGADGVNFISGSALRAAVFSAVNQPFRLVPYFDAGVWGGQWMAQNLALGENPHGRWAWGFDGVPEENSVVLRFANGFEYEMPAINLVFFAPRELLGEKVWCRFGAEFPIRFDMLDTVGGQNLSLQVHPNTEYMHDNFGGHYTQEESYYILDTEKDATPVCYLGLKDGVKKETFLEAVACGQMGESFEPTNFINTFEARKHDHFLHPAGCVHSSGSGCMVLEISSTPYIFTFKMWDWGRVDFDGKPRPINLVRAGDVLDDSFDTTRCRAECVNAFQTISSEEGVRQERTGLHPDQFIETRRWKILPLKTAQVQTHGSVNMLNLVEGDEVLVTYGAGFDKERAFKYAETFVVPECVGKYQITNTTDKPVWVLQAFVRGCD